MGNTQSSIYSKYIQARYLFKEYTYKFIAKLSVGRKKKIASYNLLASWLDFVGKLVSDKKALPAVAPRSVGFELGTSMGTSYPTSINIFITERTGARELVAKGIMQNTGSISSFESTHAHINVSYDSSTSLISLSFPPGDRYNAGIIKVSNANVLILPVIAGGSNGVVPPINMSDGEVNKINTLLDKISIELEAVYSHRGYLEAVGSVREIKERVTLESSNNKSLTTEDGRPLDV